MNPARAARLPRTEGIRSNGLSSGDRHSALYGDGHAVAAVGRARSAHILDQACCHGRPPQARATGLGRAGRKTHCCDNRSARRFDSILGELLSPALFLVLGVRALLLGKQLRDGGLRRRSLTVKLANAGAAREHYRRVDVWNIRERPVCDSHSARQPRRANVFVIHGAGSQDPALFCFRTSQANLA